jgi:predicted RNase H-like HicB family nuclease
MQYTIQITEAEGYYIASCPLIPEARAQGKTYEECEANIREVLLTCLDFRTERGEEIPTEVLPFETSWRHDGESTI